MGLLCIAQNLCEPDFFDQFERMARMRIEIENIVDEIKQAISLLRRHL
jgi:hypothetical protein